MHPLSPIHVFAFQIRRGMEDSEEEVIHLITMESPAKALDLRPWLDQVRDELKVPLAGESDGGRARELARDWIGERIRIRDGTAHPYLEVPMGIQRVVSVRSLLIDILELAMSDKEEWPEDWDGCFPEHSIALRFFITKWEGEINAYALERECRYRNLSHIIAVYEGLLSRAKISLQECSLGNADFGKLVYVLKTFHRRSSSCPCFP